ncbi:MAG: condensation domain-containing protein, partial [Gammaproteobacteria bacterium]|nr:condensation domain-containing protein [Gammaproteobacteria bacterium]
MKALDLLENLVNENIYLFVEDGKLKSKDIHNNLTEELTSHIIHNKEELIRILSESIQKKTGNNTITAVKRSDISLPLSFTQRRIWLIDQIEEDSHHYNECYSFDVNGELDVEVLRSVFEAIIRRHEIFRTTYNIELIDSEPVQLIKENIEVDTPIVDLSQFPPKSFSKHTQNYIQQEFRKPFDLCSDLMIRINILRYSSSRHKLIVTIHLIAADGWSMDIFFQEFKALYQAYQAGDENPLPPLPIQYADYAYWQRQWLQGEVLDQQLHY